MKNGKKILISGATGLVGRCLTRRLARRAEKEPGTTIVALVRKIDRQFPVQVTQVVVNYERAAEGLASALSSAGQTSDFDAVACCIGSTMRAAGSREAFLKIERDIPLTLIQYALTLPARPMFLFVSSLGADKPAGFYLKTKASVEKAIWESGLPYAILRPSLLLGERSEERPGERFAQKTVPYFFRMLASTPLAQTEWFKCYRPIEADQVAAAMETVIFGQVSSPGVLQGGKILEPTA